MTAGRSDEDGRTALETAWARSDQIFSFVSDRALLVRPIPLRQPFLFYVGHLPAFAWNHLWRRTLGRPAVAPDLDALFEAGIDPPDDAEPAPQDEAAAWPRLDCVLAYRDRVRDGLRGVLDDPGLAEVLPMVLEHELMHHETLAYMLHQLPADAKALPADRGATPSPAAPPVSRERIRIPAGPARLGTADRSFRWDNERSEWEVLTAAFEIDSLPVTVREFRAFVDAGGYADRRFWTEDGWRWVERTGRTAPQDGSAADDEWPARVSHCEAEAFCRWRGTRLPSEAEFHRAAFATPDGGHRDHPWGNETPAPEHGNLGFRRWGPAPVGAHPRGASAFGVHELVGNGWEWTSTPFRPFPGFRPLEGYPGYSADFFDDRHFVLLGGSWATDLRLVRRSFRNWFQPHYPYVFAKFRCVYPAR